MSSELFTGSPRQNEGVGDGTFGAIGEPQRKPAAEPAAALSTTATLSAAAISPEDGPTTATIATPTTAADVVSLSDVVVGYDDESTEDENEEAHPLLTTVVAQDVGAGPLQQPEKEKPPAFSFGKHGVKHVPLSAPAATISPFTFGKPKGSRSVSDAAAAAATTKTTTTTSSSSSASSASASLTTPSSKTVISKSSPPSSAKQLFTSSSTSSSNPCHPELISIASSGPVNCGSECEEESIGHCASSATHAIQLQSSFDAPRFYDRYCQDIAQLFLHHVQPKEHSSVPIQVYVDWWKDKNFLPSKIVHWPKLCEQVSALDANWFYFKTLDKLCRLETVSDDDDDEKGEKYAGGDHEDNGDQELAMTALSTKPPKPLKPALVKKELNHIRKLTKTIARGKKVQCKNNKNKKKRQAQAQCDTHAFHSPVHEKAIETAVGGEKIFLQYCGDVCLAFLKHMESHRLIEVTQKRYRQWWAALGFVASRIPCWKTLCNLMTAQTHTPGYSGLHYEAASSKLLRIPKSSSAAAPAAPAKITETKKRTATSPQDTSAQQQPSKKQKTATVPWAVLFESYRVELESLDRNVAFALIDTADAYNAALDSMSKLLPMTLLVSAFVTENYVSFALSDKTLLVFDIAALPDVDRLFSMFVEPRLIKVVNATPVAKKLIQTVRPEIAGSLNGLRDLGAVYHATHSCAREGRKFFTQILRNANPNLLFEIPAARTISVSARYCADFAFNLLKYYLVLMSLFDEICLNKHRP